MMKDDLQGNGLNMRFGRVLTAGILSGVACGGMMTTAWADVLNFEDGHTFNGKIERLVGDLIQLRSPNARGLARFWNDTPQTVHRIDLLNRTDKLVTSDKQTYTGEMIYMDAHIAEMHTNSGKISVPRYKIRELVLGMPVEQMPVATESQPSRGDKRVMPNPAHSADIPVSDTRVWKKGQAGNSRIQPAEPADSMQAGDAAQPSEAPAVDGLRQ